LVEQPQPEPPAAPVAEPAAVPRKSLWADVARGARAFRSAAGAARRKIPPLLAGLRARADSLVAHLGRRVLQVAGASLRLVLFALAGGTLIYRRSHRPPPVVPLHKVAVTIRAATPNAVIRVGDKSESPGSAIRVELLPGKYPIEVTADGYQP